MSKEPKEVAPKSTPVTMNMTNLIAGVREAATKGLSSTKVFDVPLDAIHIIPSFNPRTTENPEFHQHLLNTRDSIIKEGFFNTKPLAGFVGKELDDKGVPIKDGKDVIFLTDGHTRLAAVKLANEKAAEDPDAEDIVTLPMILKPEATSARDLNIALVRENEGRKLTTVEQAIIVKRLRRDNMNKEEIAAALKWQDKWVERLLKLVDGPKSIRDAARLGQISGTLAIKTIEKHPASLVDKKDSSGTVEKDKDGKAIKVKDFSKAEAAVKDMIAKAEARVNAAKSTGTAVKKKQATAKDTVKMASVKIAWIGKKGQKFKQEEIRGFMQMIPDTDWFTLLGAEGTGTCELTEDVEFSAVIKRPAKPKEGETDAPAKKTAAPKKTDAKAPAKAPAKGAAKKADAKAPAKGAAKKDTPATEEKKEDPAADL